MYKIQQFPWLHKVFRKFWRLNEKCKSCCCWAAFLTKSDWMVREFMEGDKAVSSDLWLHPCLFNPSNIFLHIYGNSIENIKKLSVESNICWNHSKLCSLFYFPIYFCFPFPSFCVHQQGGCLLRCIGSAEAWRVHSRFLSFILYVFVYFFLKFFSLCFKVFLFCVFSFFFCVHQGKDVCRGAHGPTPLKHQVFFLLMERSPGQRA